MGGCPRFVWVGASLVVARAAVAAPCTVRVVEAPADVRTEIEAWVRAEPSCDRSLEVRVVAARDGYAIVAHDDHGQTWERTVPDAATVAVLVVSWMAAEPDAPVASLPGLAPAVSHPATASAGEELAHAQVGGAPASLPRALTLGAIATDVDRLAPRGQLDLLVRTHAAIGVAGSSHGANLYLAGTYVLGPVTLRAQLGLGADTGAPSDRMHHAAELAPAVEAAVLVDAALGRGFGVVGGPVLDVPLRGDPTVGAFLGIRYGL